MTEDDSLVDSASYWDAPVRIVWLLKEVHDRGAQKSQMMTWARDWVREGRIPRSGMATAGPIAKVSHGILNGSMPWGDWAVGSHKYVSALKAIAWVNIKPVPGGNVSVHQEIAQAFNENRQHLRAHLRDLRPQIIVGGNTLQFCGEWLEGWTPEAPTMVRYDSRRLDGAVWVNAHHPGNRGKGWSHKGYYSRIIDAVARK